MQQRSEMAGTWTRRSAAVLAAMLVSVLFVAAQPAAASHYTNTVELSGGTNVTAAVAWSKAAFPATATEALLGRDDLFADSLASGSMQASRPLLLTNSQTLSSEANAELSRLRPSVVNIMGGPSAVSTAVENDLKSKGYEVRRFSGPTRLETAIDVARRVLPAATTAVIAAAFAPDNGDATRAFADSIAAGGFAADRVIPVLLTETDRLSTATKNYLRSALIRNIVVVGGTSAVSEAAVTELQQIGMTVRRISGPTRFDTAIRIAQDRGFADAADATEVVAVEGQAAQAWASGFASAAYSAAKDAPIVLVNGATVPAPTEAYLSPDGGAAATKLVCGPGVDGSACDGASEAMDHTPVTGTTPRLLAVTAGAPVAGETEVRFTFTEPVGAQVSAAKFKVYAYDNVVTTATSAARDAARPDVVVATFPDSVVTQGTVAAVEFAAVRGMPSNVGNVEGSAGLSSFTPAAGVTRGPNLTSVALESNDEVDYTFDQPVASCGANSKYKLVERADGDTISGTTGDAQKIDTSTCRAEFSVAIDTGGFTTYIGRAFVEPAAATGSDGAYPNPPGAVSVGGATPAPNLLTVARVSGTTTQMAYTFDKNIDTAVNVNQQAPRFKVYDSRGRVFVGTSAAPDATQTTNITRVIVTFDAGDLRNVLLGGSVEADAVKGTVTTDPPSAGEFNGPDERPMSAGTYAAGQTAAPRLTAITRSTSGSGSTASVTIRFAYNGTVSRGAGGYFVYTDEGERVALSGCSVPATDGGDEVDCTVASSSTQAYNAAKAATLAGAEYDAMRPAGQSGDPVASVSPGPEHGGAIA